MIQKIKELLGSGQEQKATTDFSAFFHDVSAAEKKKMLQSVVREANKDQRDLVKKYNTTNAA